MLNAADLKGVETKLALRIIAHATGSIAPGLDYIQAGPQLDRVLAVLTGVAEEAQQQGSRRIAGQRIGPASIDYRNLDSWFSADDRNALRAACQPTAASGAPLGSFPRPGIIGKLWPEESDYT